ncbi:MAG: hypothetical protein AAGU75_08805 [Bacillota bacterium]
MIVKLPALESELFDTWEKHIEANPELKNSPVEAKEAFEQSTDDFFSMIMLISTF